MRARNLPENDGTSLQRLLLLDGSGRRLVKRIMHFRPSACPYKKYYIRERIGMFCSQNVTKNANSYQRVLSQQKWFNRHGDFYPKPNLDHSQEDRTRWYHHFPNLLGVKPIRHAKDCQGLPVYHVYHFHQDPANQASLSMPQDSPRLSSGDWHATHASGIGHHTPDGRGATGRPGRPALAVYYTIRVVPPLKQY